MVNSNLIRDKLIRIRRAQPMGNELGKKFSREDESTSRRSGVHHEVEEEDERETRSFRREGVSASVLFLRDGPDRSTLDYRKTPVEREIIRSAFRNDDFFDSIIGSKETTIQQIIDSMYTVTVRLGQTIIKEGYSDCQMYVSARGTFEVLEKGKVVSTFNDVRLFGELAVLYNAPVLATIRAKTTCKYWILERNDFKKILMQSAVDIHNENLVFLSKIPKLNSIGNEHLAIVADLLKVEFYESGTKIITEGDQGDKFYIIRAGHVTISKKKEGVVEKLHKGHFFGELALLEQVERQATVTADPPGVECLTLKKDEFIEHFGEVPNIYAINIQATPYHFLDNIDEEHPDLKLEDLQRIATLGIGGFGRVELVQHQTRRNQVFALKCLKKQTVVEQKQQGHVFDEKTNQMSCRCVFIARLYRTFKDSKYLYFLLEPCLGGDLWSLLHRQKIKHFEESGAQFYAACVLEALAYLHDRSIIFRDLKPENLLVDSSGYVKLTDFGFTKKLARAKKTYSFVGTPEYLTPEVIMSKGHDKAVDYWAFGVLIYEMLVGKTPFRTSDKTYMATYKLILLGIDRVQFPVGFPQVAKALVRKLCKARPAERLGCSRRGVKDVKGHPWFARIDWPKLENCTLPAPFVPHLKGKTDAGYSDVYSEDLEVPPDDSSGWDEHF